MMGFFSLVSLQLPGVLSLPVIMIGCYLGRQYTPEAALAGIVGGNLLLYAFGLIGIQMALKYRVSTPTLVSSFGNLGTAFSLAMLASLSGWLVLQTKMLLELLERVLPYWPSVLILCGSYLLAAHGKVKSLARVGEILALPLVLGLIVCIRKEWGPERHFGEDSAFWTSLSLVFVAGLGIISDIPSYYLFAKNERVARLSLGVLLLAISTVQYLGAFCLKANGWGTEFSVILGISGWFMNLMNLYSAGLALENLRKGIGFPMKMAIIGFIAILVWEADLASTLEFLGLGLASVSGVMLSYAWKKHSGVVPAGSGFLIGMLGSSSLLAFIVAFMISVIFTERRYHENQRP